MNNDDEFKLDDGNSDNYQDDNFKTEESGGKTKFNFNLNLKPIFMIFGVILILIIVVVLITKVASGDKDKNKNITTNNIVNLNSELDGAYAFAKEGDHIVVLRKEKGPKTIYNLSQGTGNLGDFFDYTYYDKKLYLLFKDSIMSISLNEGNGIYELKKEYNYEKVNCKDGSSGKTSNLIVTEDIVYFNNSSCAISGFNRSEEENDGTESKQVNIYQFETLKNSNMTYSDSVLYFSGDNKIFKVSEDDGKIVEIAKDISSNYPLNVEDGVIVYSNKNSDGTYNFYGMNTESFDKAELVKNAKGLGIYNETYYYYDSKGVYSFDGEKVETIYELRYNELSNMEIIDGVLQIVDKSTIGDDKKRIVNIDLKDKNKQSNSNHEYSLIRIISK